MKKTFQKTLIAASVGAALVSAGVASHAGGTPGTTNLLFPYITTKAGAYTFISISNQAGTASDFTTTSGSQPPTLHFTYSTKAVGANKDDKCNHTDGDGTTTVNDLMQFEVQNKIDLPTLFGDRTSTPKYFPAGATGLNQEGFLVVNNLRGASYGAASNYTSLRLYGDARIIDTTTGLFFGYSTDDLHTDENDAAFRPIFSSNTGPAGMSDNEDKVLSWFPTAPVTTSLYIVPLSNETDMSFSSNVRTHYRLIGADLKQGVRAGDPVVSSNFGGHYNNNEAFQSHELFAGVTCFGVIQRKDLIGALSDSWSTNGGWGVLQAVMPPANSAYIPSKKAFVYKFETTSAVNGQPQSFMSRLSVK